MPVRSAGSRASGPSEHELLRALPSVEEVAARLGDAGATAPHALRVGAARAAIAAARAGARAGRGGADGEAIAADAWSRLERAARPPLRRVLNATGVIVHTNLGRAPL